jgi:RNA polymerase sigma factor (sigma-70 family)
VETASTTLLSETREVPQEVRGDAERAAEASIRDAGRRLFARLAAGEREALGDLYDLAATRLFGLALWRTGDPADAEEIVQEVFVRLAERRDGLGEIRDPLSWLFTVTHRAAVDRLRRRRVRAAEPIEPCDYLVAPATEPERRLDAARAARELAELPPAQREVLYLHHFQGLSFAAIGAVVGAPLFTVASRHRLGIARLRKLFEEEVR